MKTNNRDEGFVVAMQLLLTIALIVLLLVALLSQLVAAGINRTRRPRWHSLPQDWMRLHSQVVGTLPTDIQGDFQYPPPLNRR